MPDRANSVLKLQTLTIKVLTLIGARPLLKQLKGADAGLKQ